MFSYFVVVSLNVNAIPMSTRSVLSRCLYWDTFIIRKWFENFDSEKFLKVKWNKIKGVYITSKAKTTIKNLTEICELNMILAISPTVGSLLSSIKGLRQKAFK